MNLAERIRHVKENPVAGISPAFQISLDSRLTQESIASIQSAVLALSEAMQRASLTNFSGAVGVRSTRNRHKWGNTRLIEEREIDG